MTDCGTSEAVVAAFRRESLSLMQYSRQAPPYVGPADRPTWARVKELANIEAGEIQALGEYLDGHNAAPPFVGAFPTAFTQLNFIALRKLLPLLVTDQRKAVEILDADVARLVVGADAERLQRLADMKRTHLQELEKLAG